MVETLACSLPRGTQLSLLQGGWTHRLEPARMCTEYLTVAPKPSWLYPGPSGTETAFPTTAPGGIS